MGFGRSNIYTELHFADDDLQEMKIRVHDGSEPLDSTSPTLGAIDSHELLDATGSQSAFDTAVADIGGSFEDWYDAFDSGVQADIRTNMVALKAL